MVAFTITYETLAWFDYNPDPVMALDLLRDSIRLHLKYHEKIQIEGLKFS